MHGLQPGRIGLQPLVTSRGAQLDLVQQRLQRHERVAVVDRFLRLRHRAAVGLFERAHGAEQRGHVSALRQRPDRERLAALRDRGQGLCVRFEPVLAYLAQPHEAGHLGVHRPELELRRAHHLHQALHADLGLGQEGLERDAAEEPAPKVKW